MFKPLHGSVCVLESKGRFYQCDLYILNTSDLIFAKQGNGFIRLGAQDATSCPGFSLHSLNAPDVVVKDKWSAPTLRGSKS